MPYSCTLRPTAPTLPRADAEAQMAALKAENQAMRVGGRCEPDRSATRSAKDYRPCPFGHAKWPGADDTARLLYGHSDAAHMVAPLAIATTLGLGRPAVPLSVPFVLGLNGNAITLRPDLAAQVTQVGGPGDVSAIGASFARVAMAQKAAGTKLRLGVVHRYSSHNYMLRYWLRGTGTDPNADVEIVTIAPPYAADALTNGEVDGICVGAPWNSVAVERGAGVVIATTSQIWRRGVEKVLAVKQERLEQERERFDPLMRALYRAGEAFVDPDRVELITSIMARPEYASRHAAR